MDIELYIDRLVLEGIPLPPQHRATLLKSVENELARLLTDGRFASQVTGGSRLGEVPAPAVLLGTNPAPSVLGVQIAASVWRGLNHA